MLKKEDHVRNNPRNGERLRTRAENSNSNVTSAIGLGEAAATTRARKSSLFTQTVIWVTGLICLALLLGTLVQAWSNNQIMQQVQDAKKQYQQVQAHHNDLQKFVDYYKDPFVIEREARQQLGYVRPGEHAVVIVNPPVTNAQGQAPQSHPAQSQGFWQEWWNAFFGN